MRLFRVALAVSAVVALVSAVPAEAAQPSSGTLSKAKRAVRWSAGPFNVSYPIAEVDPGCSGPFADTCDHFALKVNLGDGAKIEVKISTPRGCTEGCLAQPAQGDDYDLYIYDASGILVASGATPAGNEKATFRHKARLRNKPYDVAIKPWAVLPGSAFKATAKAVTAPK